MKIRLRLVSLIALLLPTALLAQDNKNAIRYDPPDLCVVLTSRPDTTVKACIESRVTNVEQNEEGTWDVVLFYRNRRTNKEYYFWYTGLSRAIVRRNDVLKVSQPLGHISPGGKMEMLMYEFETQLDPSKYLDCTVILESKE
jgi:hypothetical protein